ncbi:AGAP012531-PA-like protein [Anopheles sinensis]|uniref:AGAP012531-PA-like protein n=1 Tax=Anopheles sinensis TaxID=74873 RepID=A0A084VUA5_ANOSI|nr:AGAP012531-PA-like protein [Anopheles sinensis]
MTPCQCVRATRLALLIHIPIRQKNPQMIVFAVLLSVAAVLSLPASQDESLFGQAEGVQETVHVQPAGSAGVPQVAPDKEAALPGMNALHGSYPGGICAEAAVQK